MANEADLKAYMEIVVENATANKAIDNATNDMQRRLENAGRKAGASAGVALSKTIGEVGRRVAEVSEKISQPLSRVLQVALGAGTGAIAAFLKSGSAEAMAFNARLDTLKSSLAGVGQKLATEVKVYGGKTMYEWAEKLDGWLKNLSTDKLQKIVDNVKALAVVVASLKGVKLFGDLAGAGANITELVKSLSKNTNNTTIADAALASSTAYFGIKGVKKIIPKGAINLKKEIDAKLDAKYDKFHVPEMLRIPTFAKGTTALGVAGASAIGAGLALAAGGTYAAYDKTKNGKDLTWKQYGKGVWDAMFNKSQEIPFNGETGKNTGRYRNLTRFFNNTIRNTEFSESLKGTFEDQNAQGGMTADKFRKRLPELQKGLSATETLISQLEAKLKHDPKNATYENALKQQRGLKGFYQGELGNVAGSIKDENERNYKHRVNMADYDERIAEAQKRMKPSSKIGDIQTGIGVDAMPSAMAQAVNAGQKAKEQREEEIKKLNEEIRDLQKEKSRADKDFQREIKVLAQTVTDILSGKNESVIYPQGAY